MSTYTDEAARVFSNALNDFLRGTREILIKETVDAHGRVEKRISIVRPQR